MTVSLTPAEAEQKIQQITDARDQAVQKLNQISDTQQAMLASAWRGTYAGGYGNTSQQQRESAAWGLQWEDELGPEDEFTIPEAIVLAARMRGWVR